jgi:two-component system chemotaxis sensor kinase CheA
MAPCYDKPAFLLGFFRTSADMSDRSSQKALAEFVSEAQETIDALDRELLRLEDARGAADADPEVLNAVFRAAHTLKGLASMFGVERMAKLAHALEDRLDALRLGRQALDARTLDLVLAAPALFTRIVGEEAKGAAPATAVAAEELAAQLRGPPPAPPGPPQDPIAAYGVEREVLSVLTEYEEHRLRTNLAKGVRLYRVRAAFDLATFDTGLDALKARLKSHGEVIATLPSAEATDPNGIAFDVLLGSAAGLELVAQAAGPEAVASEVPRATGLPAPPRISDPPPFAAAAHAPPPAAPAQETGPRAAPPAAAWTPPVPPADEAPPARDRDAPAAAPNPVAEVDGSLRSASQAVRVDIHKLDRLMNLVGELVLVKTSLLRVAERLRSGEESGTLALELHRESRALERKLDDLQGGILEVRMVPLGQIFDKLSRMVRKLTREVGKEVEFQVRGSDVELDKLIVEDLSDPLMHLIRNALDHAIEAPETRAARSKPRAGRITLAAAQRGSHVQITVEDDGAGIDEARVREVAVSRGLVSAESVAQLSRREVMNLIFLPGFSTAREVTALSGRGVGMDVVKNNIANLSGIIDLDTEVGRGTRFEITLPVTLAIIRALVVEAAGRTYAVPLNSVLEILTVDPSELRTIELREVISLRGATLPLVRLGRFFGLSDPDRKGPLFVVVVGLAQERLGVAVEGLVGQQDIVVKPLGRALQGVRGIAGATDLGSRRTVLVLDVGSIMEEVVRGDAARREAAS